jgi:hypothetical protein
VNQPFCFLVLECLWQQILQREPNIWPDKYILHYESASSDTIFGNGIIGQKKKNQCWNVPYIQLICFHMAFSCPECKKVLKMAFVPAISVHSELMRGMKGVLKNYFQLCFQIRQRCCNVRVIKMCVLRM